MSASSMVERRVYPNGGTGSSYESKTTISRPETVDTSGDVQTDGYVIVEQTNAAGTLLSRDKHYYFGSAGASLKKQAGDTYPSWKDGKEYKTETFDTNGTTILRRVEHTWEQPIAGSNWPLPQTNTLTGRLLNGLRLAASHTLGRYDSGTVRCRKFTLT